ncbi:MAG: acylphosphatase [Eubacteriales bacterium]|nr:acylphosphatase [Eubacteriales bacterium]
MGEVIRKRMVFYGDVQGVGFRYRAKYGAQELGVTGWVKNEWDGTVVMEAQGTEEQIGRLITAVQQGTFVNIRDIRMKEIFPEEHEYSFHIR